MVQAIALCLLFLMPFITMLIGAWYGEDKSAEPRLAPKLIWLVMIAIVLIQTVLCMMVYPDTGVEHVRTLRFP